MERWVHTRAFASVLGPRGRASLDAPPHGAKSSLDDDVPTPRLGRGVEPVTGGIVSISHTEYSTTLVALDQSPKRQN